MNCIRFWLCWGIAWAEQNYLESYLEARELQQGYINLLINLTDERNRDRKQR